MNKLNSNLIHRKRSPFPNREGLSGGFTVVELVVALAVILIVSATAIALINTQNTIYQRTIQTTEATNMAENAVECFRFAVENPKANDTGNDDVVSTFAKAYAKTGVTLNNVTDESGNSISGRYTIEKSNMNVTITVTANELTFVAEDLGGKEILTKSYSR